MSDYIPVREAKAVVKTDSYLQQELEDACVHGDLRGVENLITRGGDPHAKTFGPFKGTLLHEACGYGVHVTLSIIPVVSLCISTEVCTLQ